MNEIVYEEGYDAYTEGKYEDECPYSETGRDYSDWMLGYSAGARLDKGENNE